MRSFKILQFGPLQTPMSRQYVAQRSMYINKVYTGVRNTSSDFEHARLLVLALIRNSKGVPRKWAFSLSHRVISIAKA